MSCVYHKPGQDSLDGRLSVILETISHGGEDISITIGDLILRREKQEGPVTLVLQEKLMIKKSPKQILLGDFSIGPDVYTSLSFSIQNAFLFSEGRLIPLNISNEEITVDMPLDIRPWDRKNVLIKMICMVEKDEKNGSLTLKSFIKRGKEHIGPRGLKAYVTDEEGNSVLIFDRFSGAILKVVSVGEKPQGIVIAPDGTKVYIANSGSDTISVLDTLTAEIIKTIFLGLGIGPEGMAITPNGRLLITANKRSNNISLIDLDSYRIIEHIPVGSSPTRVAVSLSPWEDDWAYVTNSRSNELMIVDIEARQVVSTVNMKPDPVGVALSPDEDEVFVCCRGSNVIQAVYVDKDLNKVDSKVINEFPTNSGPIDVILDSKRGRLYGANYLSNDVCILIESMNMKESTIPVGNSPNALALDDTRRLLYVVNQGDGTVSVVDLGKERVVETIKVGSKPWGIVLDRFGID